MDTEMRALSASELAALVGVTKAEVDRLVGLGILVARDGAGPFLETDVQKVRLATACEQAGLPLDGIAAAIRVGRLSFAFLEASPYRRWAVRSARTYRQVSQETGVPLEVLGGALESMGFARMAPDELIRQDELEVVPLLQLGLSRGILDQVWLTRLGRAYAEGLRLAANVENEAYRARFTGPVRASGADQRTTMELASQLATEFLPLVDPALLGIYRRLQEADRGAGRPSRRRAGRHPGGAGRPVLARARRRAGEVAGRRGDGPLPGSRGRGAVGATPGGGAPPGRPAAGACRGGGRAGGGPGRRLLRPHREPGRPDRRPRRRGAGPGERQRGRVGLAHGGELRGTRQAAVQGDRPSGAGAGGPRRVRSLLHRPMAS